jgi:hypothetical protein
MSSVDVFGVSDDKQGFTSVYIPLISFSTQAQKEIAELYILKEANNFFVNILQLNVSTQYIPYAQTIGLQDFREIEIEYFYKTLFFDLCKRDASGKLINNLKWGVTFDAELAPIQTACFLSRGKDLSYLNTSRPYLRYHPRNQRPLYRRYGVITLNGEAVFYYLYFTLQEILDAIKPEM